MRRDRRSTGDRASAMEIRRSPWLWMAAAFCAALGLAVAVVAVVGVRGPGFLVALQATARLNFFLFWPAYAGGALTALFGNVFAPLRDNGRNFGLAFAAALPVHLGLVACLCAAGEPPDAKTFVIFGLGALFVYLLALLSIPFVRHSLPDRFWPPIRSLAMNYIAFAFLKDFARHGIGSFRDMILYQTGGYHDILMYVPFAALAILGPLLRLAAWVKKLRHQARKLSIRQQALS
jgi:hypothetical protein